VIRILWNQAGGVHPDISRNGGSAGMPADFLNAGADLQLILDGRNLGSARVHVDAARCADLKIVLNAVQPREADALIAGLSNAVILRAHPRKLTAAADDALIRNALQHNLYYPKGRIMQRMVEPLRYQVADSTFDDQGYIIHQGNMKSIPFGAFDTAAKGCGWIAAYNLLKLNGMEHTMADVRRDLERIGLLGELCGQGFWSIGWYLRSQGLKVDAAVFSRALCLSAMAHSDSGILLYTHKKGAHYTAYQRTDSGLYHFYNAVYGADRMVLSGGQFLKTYAFLPVNMLLYVKR
jgi:hypothetical protein